MSSANHLSQVALYQYQENFIRDYKRNLPLVIPFVFVFIFNWKKLKEDVWLRRGGGV